ncbi:MAG: hypothetical protein JSR64_01225 [Nitrospira sp.]|nr:hypothetical protein [Nitrospira sp.]
MNASFRPELVIDGIAALAGECRLKTVFEFSSAEDMRRGAEILRFSCEAFATAGALGGYAMAGRMYPEANITVSGGVRTREQQADVQFSVVSIDPKAFQFLRNMLGMLVAHNARLERIRVTAQDAPADGPVLLPTVGEGNESTAYPAMVVPPELFQLVWSDSQFSKTRRVIVEFHERPPAGLPGRLEPYVQAWFGLLERGAFCAPFGLPFEAESVGGRLSLFDETCYEISIARFVASEAGFRVLANMLGHFSRNVLAIARVEID